MHLHYPHHGSQTQSASTRVQRFFSPPRQRNATNNRAFFSIFYYAVNSFPHVVTAIHWAILIPRKESQIPGLQTPAECPINTLLTSCTVDEIFGHGWLVRFFVLNKYAVNSIIALFEIFFFSSIKRADVSPCSAVAPTAEEANLRQAVWAHIFGLTFMSGLYVGWSYVGYAATEKFTYYFFDHNQVGWDDASAAIMAFIASANTG